RAIPLFPETEMLIRDMSPSQLWTRYVRYIGAGAVAAAGIITLVKSIPVMLESFRIGAAELKDRVAAGDNVPAVKRTERDLSLRVVGIGILLIGLVLAIVEAPFGALDGFMHRALAAVCVIVFA